MRRLTLLLLTLLCVHPTIHAQQRLNIHGSNTIGETLAPLLVRNWLVARAANGVSDVQTGYEERSITAVVDGTTLEVQVHAHGSSTVA